MFGRVEPRHILVSRCPSKNREILTMFSAPQQEEINHLTIKLVVGLIALSLAPLTSFFAKSSITSISVSYYEGGWSQAILIGFLFAIAAFPRDCLRLAAAGAITRENLVRALGDL